MGKGYNVKKYTEHEVDCCKNFSLSRFDFPIKNCRCSSADIFKFFKANAIQVFFFLKYFKLLQLLRFVFTSSQVHQRLFQLLTLIPARKKPKKKPDLFNDIHKLR